MDANYVRITQAEGSTGLSPIIRIIRIITFKMAAQH